MPLSSVIDYAIQPQRYEVVREQIGAVLLSEFANQVITYGLDIAYAPSTVDVERLVRIDEKDFPICNVSLVKGDYDSKDYSGYVRGTYIYYVDFYTGSASTLTGQGDRMAVLALQRMMGVARSILDDTRNKTLQFDPKTSGVQIQRVSVDSLFIGVPGDVQNAEDLIWGRLKFTVVVPESTTLITPVPLAGVGLTVRLAGTSDYYFWSLNGGVIPLLGPTMDRSIVLYIKTTPDPGNLIPVANGAFIQAEYAPGDTLTPMLIGAGIGYLAGKQLYRPIFLNETPLSLFNFDIPTGVFDRTDFGGFNDGDILTLTFSDNV